MNGFRPRLEGLAKGHKKEISLATLLPPFESSRSIFTQGYFPWRSMSESHGEQAGAGRRFRRDKGSRRVAGAAVKRNEVLSLRGCHLHPSLAVQPLPPLPPVCLFILVLSSSSFFISRSTRSVLTVGKKLNLPPSALVSHSVVWPLFGTACPQHGAFHHVLLCFSGRLFRWLISINHLSFLTSFPPVCFAVWFPLPITLLLKPKRKTKSTADPDRPVILGCQSLAHDVALRGFSSPVPPTHSEFPPLLGCVFSASGTEPFLRSSPCSCVLLPPVFPTFSLQASSHLRLHPHSLRVGRWLAVT